MIARQCRTARCVSLLSRNCSNVSSWTNDNASLGGEQDIEQPLLLMRRQVAPPNRESLLFEGNCAYVRWLHVRRGRPPGQRSLSAHPSYRATTKNSRERPAL